MDARDGQAGLGALHPDHFRIAVDTFLEKPKIMPSTAATISASKLHTEAAVEIHMVEQLVARQGWRERASQPQATLEEGAAVGEQNDDNQTCCHK